MPSGRNINITYIARRTAQQCQHLMKANFIGFIETVQAEIAVGARAVIYNCMKAAAHLTIELDKRPELRELLLSREPFVSRHKQPADNAALAMQVLTKVHDESSSGNANKKAKVIRGLLDRGFDPEQIANRLSKGGVIGAVRFLTGAARTIPERSDDKRASLVDVSPRSRTEDLEWDEDESASWDELSEDDLPGRKRPTTSSSSTPLSQADRRWHPDRLYVPEPAENFEYLFVEVLRSDLGRLLRDGSHELTYTVTRLSPTWVRVRSVDDPKLFAKEWHPEDLEVPLPAAGYAYLFLEVPRKSLSGMLQRGVHEISFVAAYHEADWVRLRMSEHRPQRK